MILIIDNYDSFTYNLYQLIGSVEPDMKVIRNDECTIEEIRQMNPSAIILSPGPGKPSEAGICEKVVKELGKDIKILGVCLGHQAICETFGGTVSHAKKLMHGKQSEAKVDNSSKLFKDLPERIKVARYHSLALKEETLPGELVVTAVADDGEIMAVEHREYPVYGVQFHTESIMTPDGMVILSNFLK